MKAVQLGYVYLQPNAPVQEIVLYGESADAVKFKFEKSGEGIWRVVYTQELYTFVSPHRKLYSVEQACEVLGWSTYKFYDRAISLGIQVRKCGTYMVPVDALHDWIKGHEEQLKVA